MAELSPLIEEIIKSGGAAEITVTGSSMSPMLKDRKSNVRLSSAREIKNGDIPLYRRENGSYILHRIVGEENGTYTCCGDAQWRLEKGISKDQIIAMVTHFNRSNKWIPCTSAWYRCYWKLWVLIRPLRRIVFGGLRRIKLLFKEK